MISESKINKAMARMNKKKSPFKESSFVERTAKSSISEKRIQDRLKKDCKKAKKNLKASRIKKAGK